jgi:PAS domain S-box-containing protein
MNKRLRVIIVEDSEDDALLLIRELRKGGFRLDQVRVQTADELKEALRKSNWDVVISDYMMPGFGGLEAFKIVRKYDRDLPFIVMSGKTGEETAVAVMKAGVEDYIMKDRMPRIVPVVRRELADAATRRERHQMEAALHESEQRFRLFMENFAGVTFIKDERGRYVFINEAGAEVLRRSIDEILGLTDKEFFPEEVAKTIHKADKTVLKTGKTHEAIETIQDEEHTYTFLTVKFAIPREDLPPLLGGVSVDISKQTEAERRLREAYESLRDQREAVASKSSALREVLSEVETGKEEVRRQIAVNLDEAILPTVMRLKEFAVPGQERIIEQLETDLRNIASPFMSKIKSEFDGLSPRELEVCRLIKNGMTSKQIAEALNLSPMTIHKYRELIRKKLGLVNVDTNLSTYLQSL